MTKTLDEMSGDPFWQGFDFARQVFRAKGLRIKDQELIDLFHEVILGQVTLTPAPEEAIQDSEFEGTGSEALKKLVRLSHSSSEWRRIGVKYERTKAQEYLDVFDPFTE